MKRNVKRAKRTRRAHRRRPAHAGGVEPAPLTELASTVLEHPETGPRLSGGDVDADWRTAWASGEEAVGGSAATPDQDVVDEIGDALGVPQPADSELRTSQEILAERDRHRWRLEREADEEERAP